MWRNWNSLTLLMGMYNGTVPVGNSLAGLQEVKHSVII